MRPTIVLIHGLGGHALSWPVEIRRLSGYRVISLDLPGHGKSDAAAFQKIDFYYRAITRFLRELEVFTLVLVGHSFGSAIAMNFAAANPDQVKGLVLLSTAERYFIPPEIFHAVADSDTYPIGVSMFRKWFFSPRTPANRCDETISILKNQRSTVLYSDFLTAARMDIKKNQPMISCPTWIACGKQDLITPPSTCRELMKQFQNAYFTAISAAGHMLPQEQPEKVATGLRDFLSTVNFSQKDIIEKSELSYAEYSTMNVISN